MIRLGRARRRAVARRALLGRRMGVASAVIADALAPSPEPVVAGGPSLVAPSAMPPSGAPLAVRTLPMGDVPPADDGVPVGRLRRCAFRRLDLVAPGIRRGEGATYAVMCLYGDAAGPEPLGDLPSAAIACGACTYTGIFRPDEA